MRSFVRIIAVALATYLAPTAALAADPLSEEALFVRCRAHFTQERPKFNDPLLLQVRNGQRGAIGACMELLSRANFSNGSQIADPSDQLAKDVLSTFHNLHREWAREKEIFNPQADAEMRGTVPWFDGSPGGAYFTRALFSPNHDVRSILTGSSYLQPVRTNMSPAQDTTGRPNANETFLFGTQIIAPIGELLGIRSISRPAIDFFGTQRLVVNYNESMRLELLGPPSLVTEIPNLAMQGSEITDFIGTLSEPGGGPVLDNYGILIQGRLRIPTSGSYTFYGQFDDYARVYLDNQEIFDDSPTGQRTNAEITSGPFQLQARDYTIRIEFLERTGFERIHMRWEGPGISREFIPDSAFRYDNNGTLEQGLEASFYHMRVSPPFELTGHEGGGFIGHHGYLMTTFQEAETDFISRANGALATNRTWARAVLHDTICREPPYVRASDVQQWVIPSSETAFRQQDTCTQCHATMDRLNGAIRGIGWNTMRSNFSTPTVLGFNSITKIDPIYPESQEWSDQPDPIWSTRAPYGVLYFRNYRGELVNRAVRSFSQIGNELLAQDDFYVCIAKRYWEYFHGVKVPLGDPEDPTFPQLTGPDQYHQGRVIALGLALRQHRDMSRLIRNIISEPTYRMTDYGVTYGGAQ